MVFDGLIFFSDSSLLTGLALEQTVKIASGGNMQAGEGKVADCEPNDDTADSGEVKARPNIVGGEES